MSGLSKERVFANVFWATFGRVLSMMANFVATLALARAISPNDYGIYSVALTTLIIVAGIGALGMDMLVIRFSGLPAARENPAIRRQVIALCLCIVTAAGLLVGLVFLWVAPQAFRSILRMPGLAPYAALLATWIFFATIQRQLAESFRGLNDIRMVTLSGGVRNGGLLNGLLVCVGMSTLWFCGWLTLSTALGTMLTVSIVVVVSAGIVLYRRMRATGRADVADAKPVLTAGRALREGWPLGLSSLIVIINNQGSGWLASPMDTPAHIALFGVSLSIMRVMIAPMIISNEILPPIIAELAASGQMRRLERVVKSIGGMVLLPSLMILAMIVLAGRPILGELFGPYYRAAYPILVMICVGQTINIGTGAWQIILPMTGNKHWMLTSSAIAVVTQVALGLGLGYHYGVFGVAAGYCTSITVTNLIGMVFVRRTLGIWTYPSISGSMLREAIQMVKARVMRKAAWQRT